MRYLLILSFFFTISITAQDDTTSSNKGYYLEDQLYIGASYNLLRNKPNDVSLRGVSNSFFTGYIRDIPLNEQRSFGLGIGLGYARDRYFHNMKISVQNNQVVAEDFQDLEEYNSNELLFHKLELPFQIRWRKSTIDKYKFFRIYTGVKFSYVLYSKSQFNLNGFQKYRYLDAVNKFQYGLSLSIGQGTWNAFVYYGLNSIFKEVKYNNADPLNLKSIKLGVIFYIM